MLLQSSTLKIPHAKHTILEMLKFRYRQTKPPSFSVWYEDLLAHAESNLMEIQQERELEKVNIFYLQKEAEVCCHRTDLNEYLV